MNFKKDLYIAAPALPVQERKHLLVALKVLQLENMCFHILDESPTSAHLLVLDGDSASGQRLLRASREGQVKLLISTQPTAGKNIIAIKKPYNIQSLTNLLKKLFLTMREQIAKKQKSTKPSLVRKQTNVNSDKTLFALLLDVKSQRKIVRISCSQHHDIYVDGVNRSLVTSASHEEIKEIIGKPYEEMTIDYLPGSDFAVHNSAMNVSTLHHILWISGLENSNGKIIQGHDLDQPIRLRAWPNFTRNDFKAEHLKLAAIMARQALSISELSQLSNIPLVEVINFYNAAFAVDLIDFNDQSQSMPVRQNGNSHQHRSLLTKIANRLSIWR